MDGSSVFGDLGIGTTDDYFHFSGTLPLVMDILNSSVRVRAMEGAVPLSILADIPSGPDALLVSKAFRRLKTSSSVQRISYQEYEE